MTIFNNIKKTATSRGLSIEKVADLATKSGVKVSKSAIYDWDKHEPNPNKIKAVAEVLNVSTNYLLGNTDEMIPNKKESSVTDLDDPEASLAFNGKPLSDNQRLIIKTILEGMNKE